MRKSKVFPHTKVFMKIAVIGAGIIGITTAYELARDGHDVTVFERNNAAAEGASFANTGVMAPSHTLPLSTPDWVRPSALHFLKSLHAFSIKGGVSLQDLQWLWAWGKTAGSDIDASRLTAARTLGSYSQQQLHRIKLESKLEFEGSAGHLLILRTEANYKAFQPTIASLKASGVALRELQPADITKIEPSFHPDHPIHSAVHLPNDGVGNCRQFGLLLKAATQQIGVTFRFGTHVEDIQTNPRLTLIIQGEASNQSYDRIVLCTGEAAPFLKTRLRIKLPMACVHGYSVSAAIREPLNAPTSALTDIDSQIVIARIGNRVRVSGGAELGGNCTTKDPKTIQSLFKALQDYFPGAAQYPHGTQVWKGSRILTADGLPIIGMSAMPGVWLNLAHGANGWGTACGSARIVADQISGKAPQLDPDPFSPARSHGG